MKVQKTAAIVLILTAFSSIGGNSPSQAQTNIRYSPENFNISILSQKHSVNVFNINRDIDLFTPMTIGNESFQISLKQNFKRKPPLERAAMDDILQLTTEQVIKKNNLLKKLAYNFKLIDKELEDSLSNSQSRNVALAISKEKKTALNRNFFAELRKMLTPKQLKNKKGLDFLAQYEEFWVTSFS
jgi:hypothetical protein